MDAETANRQYAQREHALKVAISRVWEFSDKETWNDNEVRMLANAAETVVVELSKYRDTTNVAHQLLHDAMHKFLLSQEDTDMTVNNLSREAIRVVVRILNGHLPGLSCKMPSGAIRRELAEAGLMLQVEHPRGESKRCFPLHPEKFKARAAQLGIQARPVKQD